MADGEEGMNNEHLPTFRAVDRLADPQTMEILDKIGESVTNPTLNIVVSGKTGVGKTTLIDGLFLPEGQAYQEPERTDKISMRSRKISSPSGREITVEITDTPGTEALSGVGNKSHRAQYLKEVTEPFKNADIVLLCVRMDDDIREEEVQMIGFFYKTFSDFLWAKVVFILTFANRVTVDCRNEDQKEQVYTKRFEDMKGKLREAMKQARVRADMVTQTPVCVAGHPEYRQLPNSDDWACPFLVDLLKSGIADNVKFALLNATWRRWFINPGRASAGAAGITGFLTGIGLISAGGVMSTTPVTLPFGISLMLTGGGISIYSVAATAYRTSKSIKQYKANLKVPQKVKDFQQGEQKN